MLCYIWVIVFRFAISKGAVAMFIRNVYLHASVAQAGMNYNRLEKDSFPSYIFYAQLEGAVRVFLTYFRI